MVIHVEIYPFIYPAVVKQRLEPHKSSLDLMNRIHDVDLDLEKEQTAVAAWVAKKARIMLWSLGAGAIFFLVARAPLHPPDIFPEWAKIIWLFAWGIAQVFPWLAGLLIVIEGSILGLNGAVYLVKNRMIHGYLEDISVRR